VAWDERAGTTPPLDCELLLLDQALGELAVHDLRQARVVELRYVWSVDGANPAAPARHRRRAIAAARHARRRRANAADPNRLARSGAIVGSIGACLWNQPTV
jgi:hypothetical protein